MADGKNILIEVHNLKKYFPVKTGFMKMNHVKAVDDVSFYIEKGETLGLLGSAFLGPVVLVVIITTIVTPVFLKLAYRSGVSHTIPVGEGFSNVYEEMGKYRSGAYMFKEHEEMPQGERR